MYRLGAFSSADHMTLALCNMCWSHDLPQKLALAMRVGVIKMGGFLRSVFEGIERQSQKAELDFTAAK